MPSMVPASDPHLTKECPDGSAQLSWTPRAQALPSFWVSGTRVAGGNRYLAFCMVSLGEQTRERRVSRCAGGQVYKGQMENKTGVELRPGQAVGTLLPGLLKPREGSFPRVLS